MDPVTTREVLTPEQELGVTELPDGSAIMDMPAEEVKDQDFYSNLAESLDQFQLNSIATDLLELIKGDKEAREKRDKQYEEGIQRTGLGDDAPGGANFDGASKVVHPVLAEGCVDFAARAIKELFPANGPVKTKTFGPSDEAKLEKAKRKRDFLNWYTTVKMPEYRSEKEILLTQLPLGGSQYEKYWFDPTKRRICMEFVPIDKVLLPFAASSFYTTPRLTHLQDITRSQFEARVRSGLYADLKNIVNPGEIEETAAEEATDRIEGLEQDNYNADGLRLVYEVSCELDFEGEVRPYVVHIDEPTSKIVGFYRNWKEEDETAQKLDWWVEDKFIPWRGVYGIGLPHLIGGLASALTGALRALLDAAHINNSPGAVKLKGGRTSGQNLQVPQTGVVEVDAPAGTDDIRKVMMPLPFNPPSNVLFQLLDWITNQAKGVVATAEERIADAGNNMPVGTALALIEQGSQVFSSIHGRLHEAQRRALQIICRLIRQYPEEHAAELQRFGLNAEDFNEDDDVQPVSDPNIFSESQRYAQMQAVMQLATGDTGNPQVPWNQIAIRRRMLELLRVDNVDEFLPKPPQPVSADPITENMAAVNNQPIKASPQQDHLAHAMTHVGFVLNPIHSLNPAPMPQLMGILSHVAEHLNLYYQVTTMAMAEQVMMQAQVSGEQLGPDQIAMRAAQQAQQLNMQLLQDLAQMMQQATQVAQQKMPPPQLPPEVQVTKDVAMAEIQRKAEESKANAAQKQQDAALDMRMAEMGNVFKMQLESAQAQAKKEADALRMQMELMKNEQDNRQHQMTELMKNREDNQTAIIIAQLKEAISTSIPKPAETPQLSAALPSPVAQGLLQALTQALGEKTSSEQDELAGLQQDMRMGMEGIGQALAAVVQGIQSLAEDQKAHREHTLTLASQLLNTGE